MFKEQLEQQQPVVYHTLKNALENDKLAHAYMFSGPSGTPKKQTAYLLAQSLVCNEKGFACETCDTCQRVLHNEYADMIYIDGTTRMILSSCRKHLIKLAWKKKVKKSIFWIMLKMQHLMH